MRAHKSPFEGYMSKRILFFAYLMCSSASGVKVLERVSVKCGPDGGGWRMADGGWRMADDKMRIEKCGR